MRTEKELVQEALDVQDACNLSGVVYSFSRALSELRALRPNDGTDEINNHIISVLYSSKIESLTGSSSAEQFSIAYRKATNIIQGV